MIKLKVKHDTTEYPVEIKIEEVCDECGGTGEVSTMEHVYAGEPHMAPIGTRPCICQLREPDESCVER